MLVAGRDLVADREAALRRMGCIVESPDFYDYLTGRENLRHFARMIDAQAQERIDPLSELLRIHERLDDRVGTYSLGMRQRLGIVQALAGRSGGAGAGRAGQRAGSLGHPASCASCCAGWPTSAASAVFVSSHLLGEVEKVCDRLAIVHRGRVLAEGSVAELTSAGRRSLEDIFIEVTDGETV